MLLVYFRWRSCIFLQQRSFNYWELMLGKIPLFRQHFDYMLDKIDGRLQRLVLTIDGIRNGRIKETLDIDVGFIEVFVVAAPELKSLECTNFSISPEALSKIGDFSKLECLILRNCRQSETLQVYCECDP